MPEVNPITVIADCIDGRSGVDRRLLTEALGILQIDNTEEDAFHMLGSAIADAVADDEAHSAGLLGVSSELEEQRKVT